MALPSGRAGGADAPEPLAASQPEALIPSAKKRDYRGRFLRAVKWTPEGSCEWLIWSRYWRGWHRKGATGGACGYTDDIAEAGLFPRHMAVAYNDDRDTPYHISEKIGLIQAAAERHVRALEKLRAASAMSARSAETAETGSVRQDASAAPKGGDAHLDAAGNGEAQG